MYTSRRPGGSRRGYEDAERDVIMISVLSILELVFPDRRHV